MHEKMMMTSSTSRQELIEKASPKQGQTITSTDEDKVSMSSRLWTSLKNPRIVRVSRSFGGKDRHSKVTTVRGLRDRRVRLSVPTAIQLYDLQHKLGLNQPSKVVDWLINAAQHEIDKLPPLEIPPGNLMHFSPSMPLIFDRTVPNSLNHRIVNSKGVSNSVGDPKSMNNWSLVKEKEVLNDEPNHVVGLMNHIGMTYQSGQSSDAYHSLMASQEMISMLAPCITTATNNLDAKQASYFLVEGFANENSVTNRSRGCLQTSYSSVSSDRYDSKVHKFGHQK